MTTKATKSHIYFFLLVFALSVPFWVLGTFINLEGIIPINLPVSALMLLCPITTAIILTRKVGKKNGVKLLLKRVADYKKVKKPIWIIPTFLLMPILMLTAYAIMNPEEFVDTVSFFSDELLQEIKALAKKKKAMKECLRIAIV